MSTVNSKAIVVGVDGSGSSLDAVGWAAREAELRGAPLKLVSAYQIRPSTPVSSHSRRTSAPRRMHVLIRF